MATDRDGIKRELGELLRKIREDAGKFAWEAAAIAGRSQSWWTKLEKGWPDSVDVASLRRVAAALGLPPETSARMFALADALNKTPTVGRGVLMATGSQHHRTAELRVNAAPHLRLSRPDTIPIPLWCTEFGEAVSAGKSPLRGSTAAKVAGRWRERLAARPTVVEWRLSEASIRRRYGLSTDVLAA